MNNNTRIPPFFSPVSPNLNTNSSKKNKRNTEEEDKIQETAKIIKTPSFSPTPNVELKRVNPNKNEEEGLIKKVKTEFDTKVNKTDCLNEKSNEVQLTPLHEAAANGDIEKVKSLLENGADYSAKTSDELTPFSMAAQKGHLAILSLFLELKDENGIPLKDYFLNEKSGLFESTALHWAAFSGRYDAIKLLLKEGADYSAKTADGATPFSLACLKGHLPNVSLFLELKDENGISLKDYFLNEKFDLILNEKSGLFEFTALHIAAHTGNEEFVKLLLKEGADYCAKTTDGRTPFSLACGKGNPAIVSLFLELKDKNEIPLKDYFLNEKFDLILNEKSGLFEFTALHIAAHKGNEGVVKLLLKEGADYYAKTKDGRTPFYLASQAGNSEVLSIFLGLTDENGVSIKDRFLNPQLGINEWTALHSAVFNGHTQAVELLLKSGANYSLRGRGYTPFYIAVKNAKFDIISLFLELKDEKGISLKDKFINEKNGSDEWTALHEAVYFGTEATVKVLLKNGADCFIKTKDGRTPFYLATQAGKPEILSIFLGFTDANGVSQKDKFLNPLLGTNEWTALHSAAFNGHTQAVELLLKSGANYSLRDQRGSTPFYLASENGKFEIVSVFLNLKDENGLSLKDKFLNEKSGLDEWTALHATAYFGKEDTVNLLLKNGADCFTKTKMGRIPFHLAAQTGKTEVLSIFLGLTDEKGVSLKDRFFNEKFGKDEWVALHLAASCGNHEAVTLFLKEGADYYAKTKDGRTPFYLALQTGKPEVLSAFLKLKDQEGNSLKQKFLEERYGELETTALHRAVQNNHLEVVKLLIKEGVDIFQTTLDGLTPLSIATESDVINEICKAIVENFNLQKKNFKSGKITFLEYLTIIQKTLKAYTQNKEKTLPNSFRIFISRLINPEKILSLISKESKELKNDLNGDLKSVFAKNTTLQQLTRDISNELPAIFLPAIALSMQSNFNRCLIEINSLQATLAIKIEQIEKKNDPLSKLKEMELEWDEKDVFSCLAEFIGHEKFEWQKLSNFSEGKNLRDIGINPDIKYICQFLDDKFDEKYISLLWERLSKKLNEKLEFLSKSNLIKKDLFLINGNALLKEIETTKDKDLIKKLVVFEKDLSLTILDQGVKNGINTL